MSSDLLLQTLQHLSQAARIVDGDNRTNQLLHCYYLSRIQSLAASGNVSLENSSYSSCDKCTTSFNDGNNFSLSIKPRKLRKEKYKKLSTNLDSKSRQTGNRLLKFKRNFGKKYQRLIYNVAETTCKLCHSNNKSSIRFDNKDKFKPSKTIEAPNVELNELELVKSKKRKRDKNAGLIIKDNERSSDSLVPARSIIQPKLKVLPTKPKVKVPPPTKSKTNKKSKNAAADKKTKISSAQKQKKGILLLANVLKMKDDRQQESSQMKLNKMFK